MCFPIFFPLNIRFFPLPCTQFHCIITFNKFTCWLQAVKVCDWPTAKQESGNSRDTAQFLNQIDCCIHNWLPFRILGVRHLQGRDWEGYKICCGKLVFDPSPLSIFVIKSDFIKQGVVRFCCFPSECAVPPSVYELLDGCQSPKQHLDRLLNVFIRWLARWSFFPLFWILFFPAQ